MTSAELRGQAATPAEQARQILTSNRYLVVATATPGAAPWVTSVYFAHQGLDTLWWVSRPSTRHSRLIAANPQVAITIFDSSVPVGHASAVYAEAWAQECSSELAADEVHLYSKRSIDDQVRAWTALDVTGPSELRLYRAQVTALWILATGDGPDRRIRVDTGSSQRTLDAQHTEPCDTRLTHPTAPAKGTLP
ncbi:MAG: pyridoxamine 5'-phosphate oxidase family protein [Tetrasphaera sp.]